MSNFTIISISDLVESVRQARADYRLHMDEIIRQRDALNARLAPTLALRDEAKASLEEAERQLRAASVAHFKATGEKHPHPAVAIREAKPVTLFEYSPIDALKYALEKGVALKLDESLFETYMQALPEPSRPSWFRIRTETPEPTAAISKIIEEQNLPVSDADMESLPF